nr:immunoglobulin light chain junction region [Macaca mulatta]MOX22306.1 immunoglobulin light chain junction region [Macaca mulatta]MOX23309.1 immunoglobulin light chain junction region [Macaca mulatta]
DYYCQSYDSSIYVF